MGLDAASHVEIDDTRFDHNARIGNIHFKDVIHARQAEDNAVFDGKRAAAQAGAGTARDEWDFFAMADAQDGLNLLGGVRKQHGARENAEIGEPITFVGAEFLRRRDEAAFSDDGTKLVENSGVHSARIRIKDSTVQLCGRA